MNKVDQEKLDIILPGEEKKKKIIITTIYQLIKAIILFILVYAQNIRGLGSLRPFQMCYKVTLKTFIKILNVPALTVN